MRRALKWAVFHKLKLAIASTTKAAKPANRQKLLRLPAMPALQT